MDSGDQRCGVDGCTEGLGVLQEEEVGDVGEVGLVGVDHALEDAEVDEGGGFEWVGDGIRIPRSCGPARTARVGSLRERCKWLGWRDILRGPSATLRMTRWEVGRTSYFACSEGPNSRASHHLVAGDGLHLVAAHFVVVEAFEPAAEVFGT